MEAALVLGASADRAPEAPLVTATEVAAELAARHGRLRTALGPDGLAAAEARTGSSPRVEVLDAALAAVDTALA